MVRFENTSFVKSSAGPSDFLRDGRPQVVLAGRSNVGKSSLLNCLARRKQLARVSGVPGKTALVNYFLVDDAIYLVDLPGYGYARVAQGERQRWGRMMSSFFADTSAVSAGLLVVDARHKPTADDNALANLYRDQGIPFFVAANKCDKIGGTQAALQETIIRAALQLNPEQSLTFCSAQKGVGRDALMALISEATHTTDDTLVGESDP